MFREFSCGCIHSHVQGQVRYCATHPATRLVQEPVMAGKLPAVVKTYPANGIMVANWKGR